MRKIKNGLIGRGNPHSVGSEYNVKIVRKYEIVPQSPAGSG